MTFIERLRSEAKEVKPAADTKVIDTIYFKLEGCFAIVIDCTERLCCFNICRTTPESFTKIAFVDEVLYSWERIEELYQVGRLIPPYSFRSS